MTEKENIIYETLFNNSILFLNRGIKEVLSHNDNLDAPLNTETGVVSTLFIQMSIELALKAFLLKNQGIKSILKNTDSKKNEDQIYYDFEMNDLHTIKFNDLKQLLNVTNPAMFSETDTCHIEQFQKFRNKLVHFNLFLAESDLYDLKYEIIYVIVHIIVPLLSETCFEFETPTSFYNSYLDKNDYQKLISFSPYVNEMENLAKINTGMNYHCPVCNKKAYSPKNDLCYCCNLNFDNAAEYTSCLICHAKKSVIFDPLNISINDNIINGLCLNCNTKLQVFKCTECDCTYSFSIEEELDKCTPKKCYYED